MIVPTRETRDRWLCVALPAALSALAYGIFFARPLLDDVRTARAELQRQPSSSIRMARLADAQAEQQRLLGALAIEREHETALQNSTSRMDASSPSHRAATLLEISRCCEAFQITLLSIRPEGDRKTVPEERIDNPLCWRLELCGSYQSMVNLLDTLTAGPLPLVPMGLDMASTSDDGTPIAWMLIVQL